MSYKGHDHFGLKVFERRIGIGIEVITGIMPVVRKQLEILFRET